MRGFEDSFPQLYRRAYGTALRVTSDPATAADIGQETLIRAYVRWWRVQDYADRWVVRVATNLALDDLRRRKRSAAVTLNEGSIGSDEASFDEVLDLRAALGVLSRRQRDVVTLRFLAGMPVTEVSAALGCSEGSVKTHTARAMQRLRKRLS